MAKKPDLLPGTLDMLILKTLKRAPLHGYGIALSIKRLSDDVLTVEEGSLYPALQRLLLQPAGAVLHADSGRTEAARS
jgi:PadR family transcriptional regulator, regulatory protein PadR